MSLEQPSLRGRQHVEQNVCESLTHKDIDSGYGQLRDLRSREHLSQMNADLERSRILPDLRIVDGAGKAEHTEAPTEKKGTTEPSAGRTWTVVVDLGMSAEEGGVKEGSDQELEKMKRLAAKTEGTGVTMVVQKLTAAKPGEDPAKSVIDRYIIRDGKITELGSAASQGYAQDLKGLLSLATREAPSAKIALISMTHGGGADGVLSDNGHASLDELKKAISDGLQGSGHKSLDLLDFDACLMGSQSVEDKFHDVADHIVASEEVEVVDGNRFDGQNLKKVVGDLLAHPDMTASQLADDFIDRAKKGANGAPSDRTAGRGGTDTLAHFDSSQYKQFKESLDSFGKALSRVLEEPGAKAKLQEIIASTPSFSRFPTDEPSAGDSERDLKTFAEKVLQAVKDGTLPDPEHGLAKAAQSLLDAEKALTSSYYGEARGGRGYDGMGGLSVYLPHGGTDAIRERVQRSVGFDDWTKTALAMAGSSKELALRVVGSKLKDLQSLPEPSSPAEKKKRDDFEAAAQSFGSAKSESEFQKALADLEQASRNLIGSQTERELIDRATRQFARQSQLEFEQHVPSAGSWRDFLESMQ